MSTRKLGDLFWGAMSLLFMLVVLRFILSTTSRYAPAPISTTARRVGRYADPGGV